MNVRFTADPTSRWRGDEGLQWVELPRSGARAGMAANGATSPFGHVPTKDRNRPTADLSPSVLGWLISRDSSLLVNPLIYRSCSLALPTKKPPRSRGY